MTTAIRTPQVPAPTGDAWAMFARCNPAIPAEGIAARWAKAQEIYAAGLVGAPDLYGTREVRSQNGVDLYTVSIASVRPRSYFCSCPDFAGRNPFGGWCKHALACYLACVALQQQRCEEKAAEAAFAAMMQRNPAGTIRLLLAIDAQDARTARTAVAQFTGWPPRSRKGKEVSV